MVSICYSGPNDIWPGPPFFMYRRYILYRALPASSAFLSSSFCAFHTYNKTRYYCYPSKFLITQMHNWTRDVPDIRFRFRLAGYPAVFFYPVPAPVPAEMVPGTGYLYRIVLGRFRQLVIA